MTEPDYRKAAIAALDQLEWCIGYLRRIRKPGLARQLTRNKDYIRDHVLEPTEEPAEDAAGEPSAGATPRGRGATSRRRRSR